MTEICNDWREVAAQWPDGSWTWEDHAMGMELSRLSSEMTPEISLVQHRAPDGTIRLYARWHPYGPRARKAGR